MINLHTSMNHKDRALFHAYQDLDKVGKQILGLPDSVMYQVKIKYKAFNEAVLTRGAVRNGIKANCVFQACRECGVARTTKEIADAFGIPARDLSRTFDMYQEQLPETEVHVTGSAHLVPRFFNDVTCVPMDQRGRIKMKIIKVCKELEDCVELQGRTPKAVAAAIMFVVLKEAGFGPDKNELCRICDVSAPTLGKIEAIVRNLRNT
jgi:transcription initiation factor TFIIIB Brf1 subunit/transcription initiation factor TFIIB